MLKDPDVKKHALDLFPIKEERNILRKIKTTQWTEENINTVINKKDDLCEKLWGIDWKEGINSGI